jgi:hypothetical protein
LNNQAQVDVQMHANDAYLSFIAKKLFPIMNNLLSLSVSQLAHSRLLKKMVGLEMGLFPSWNQYMI